MFFVLFFLFMFSLFFVDDFGRHNMMTETKCSPNEEGEMMCKMIKTFYETVDGRKVCVLFIFLFY